MRIAAASCSIQLKRLSRSILLVAVCCGAVSACSDGVCADKVALAAAIDACHADGNSSCTSAGIAGWDVSAVADMSGLFHGKTHFNGNLSGWDVGGVNHMDYMFYDASSFNGDLAAWDVGSVINMYYMFSQATSFNADLTGWDVGSLTSSSGFSFGATSFFEECTPFYTGTDPCLAPRRTSAPTPAPTTSEPTSSSTPAPTPAPTTPSPTPSPTPAPTCPAFPAATGDRSACDLANLAAPLKAAAASTFPSIAALVQATGSKAELLAFLPAAVTALVTAAATARAQCAIAAADRCARNPICVELPSCDAL